jgi:hypothetical protein
MAAAKAGALSPERILREVSKQEDAFIKMPNTDYVLVTGISLTGLEHSRSISSGKYRIILERTTPKRYVRDKALEEARRVVFGEMPKNYAGIRMFVFGRSLHEAAESGLDTLELLRGIWNFGNNRLIASRHSGPRPHPVNAIQLAPVHTLHSKEGSPISDSYWYDPNYVRPVQPFDLRRHKLNLFQFESHVRKRLQNHAYSKTLCRVLSKYARALDGWNLTATLVSMWSLLEMLTDTSTSRYDDTVKRASFLYRDRDYAHQILNHIRTYRNRAVHSIEETEHAEYLVYELKRYIDTLLEFHIVNRLKFRTLEDAAYFLSMPANISDIRVAMSRFRKALRFRT